VAIRRRIRASGEVQGVFFRDSVRQEAEKRGVAGWVRNCSDGTVEAVFEGDEDAISALVGFSRSDPGSSSVAHLDVTEEEPEGLEGFDVRG
jgi:acylphosphatase